MTLLASVGTAAAQDFTYSPLHSWVAPEAQWSASLQAASERLPVSAERGPQPQLAGLRPKSVELLEDALLRKHPKLLQDSPERARELILRRYRSAEGPLRGYMAEAMFMDRNTEWNYVDKPNATQHDVTRWIDGRSTPFNGQIKYHDDGKAASYARDMIDDYRAHRFFIPDDHVESTKAYIREHAERAQGRGNRAEAQRLWRDYSRVRPIGATSSEIRSATTEAARYVARERYAVYTSFGAASALALAPWLIDMSNGDLTANRLTYEAARTASLLGVWYGTERGLAGIRNGALRGTTKGTAIIGGALVLTELGWLVHEHGWRKAFYRPEFYQQAVGGVSATGLAFAAGLKATELSAGTGIWAPVIGGGAAIVAGTVGYVGGESLTREVIEFVNPEMLRRAERQMVGTARDDLARKIANTQGWDGSAYR
ncbi:MAG: hypothetical protein ACM3L9_06030 [Deltaproteobacteria bacterium]